MVLIKLINGLLLFLSDLNICGNMAPILAYKGIEYFLYFGLKNRGLYIVNL